MFIEVSADVPTGLVELRKGVLRRYMVLKPGAAMIVKCVYWSRVDNGWSPSLVAPVRGTRARRWDKLYLNVVPS